MRRACVVLATVALTVALVAGYVRVAVGDSAQFADRASTALSDPAVRDLVATRVTDELVRQQSDLLAARPIIESVVGSVVGSRAFTGTLRTGVRDVHRAVFDRDQNTVTLTVADVGTLVAAALEAVRPELAGKIDATGRVELVREQLDAVSSVAAGAARTVSWIAALALALGVAFAAAALLLVPDRRRTVAELGAGAAVAGVLLVLALTVVKALVASRVAPDARAAAHGVWDAYFRDLRDLAWVFAAAGVIVAAAARSLLKPVELRVSARRLLAEPERPALRVLRGVALIALGLLVLADRELVLQLVFAAVGLTLVYAGVSAILWVVYDPRTVRPAPRPGRRPLLAAALAGVLVAGTAGAFVGTGGVSAEAPETGACNGHAELCGRTLPQVTLAATHNSMSVPLPGWFSAEQGAPIAAQLRAGIRGLLIDTHYADRLPDGKLRTDDASLQDLREQDAVSPEAVRSALRIRERLGFDGQGDRGLYLCHSFCELGGTGLGSVLDDLREFLVTNPDEVLVVINQDYVTPADFVAAVREAGLERFAFTPPAGDDWPTLREMIDSGRRVLFLAENRAGGAPWYQLAYRRLVQETPYAFSSPAALLAPDTCGANRGPADAPLFLVNHWVTTDPWPRPTDASRVNALQPLLDRLRTCERTRRRPNLVAVNFFERGDLLRAVDALNGVS